MRTIKRKNRLRLEAEGGDIFPLVLAPQDGSERRYRFRDRDQFRRRDAILHERSNRLHVGVDQ